MKGEMINFVEVTSDRIIDFILSANERIIIAKPGYSKEEIEQLINLAKKNIEIELYIESGDQPIRYGFGDKDALELLHTNLDILNVQTANRIRMGMVIVDNKSLIFTPNISFMEEETKEMTFPNGLIGDEMYTQEIIEQLFHKKPYSQLDFYEAESNVILFPGSKLEIKADTLVEDELQESINMLEVNPAVDPRKLRQVNLYRNNYKLVKPTIYGINIKAKKVNLRLFLSLLSNQNDRLISSWEIFTSEDVKKFQDTILFKKEMEKVFNKYLRDAKRFGYILETRKKSEFNEKIQELTKDFIYYIDGEVKEDNYFVKLKKAEGLKDNKDGNIIKLLESSRDELLRYLLGISKNDKGFTNQLFIIDRNLKYKVDNDKIDQEEARKDFIETFIDNNLKFPCKEDIIKQIGIKVDYYDISDELIEDTEFQDILKLYEFDDLHLREYGQAFEIKG